jgi:hypothetical protein
MNKTKNSNCKSNSENLEFPYTLPMARLKSDETKIQISNVSVEKRMRCGRNSTTFVYNPGGATAASFLTNVHPVPVFLFPRHVMAAMCALLPQPQRDNCRMRVPAARSWRRVPPS